MINIHANKNDDKKTTYKTTYKIGFNSSFLYMLSVDTRYAGCFYSSTLTLIKLLHISLRNQ